MNHLFVHNVESATVGNEIDAKASELAAICVPYLVDLCNFAKDLVSESEHSVAVTAGKGNA